MSHVLIVDDDIDALSALQELVAREGFTVDSAAGLAEARECVARHRPDVVLLDLVLPDGQGMELFRDLDSRTTEVVLITGHASLQTSIEALRLGAADYLTKPINPKQLRSILSRIARPADLKAEITKLRGDLRDLGRFGHMVGVSTSMQKVYDQISRVAPTAATVLILGESGTGKEVVAETLHELSHRRKKAFLPVNCSAISSQLMESEMFGHEKGSFTGATRDHKGYFEQADGGTLFLDEVTEMPIELQAKLLRVLETSTFMPVGAARVVETDVRVVAATNRSPDDAVRQGRLREDLLYRLQVFPLSLPPLREREGDIPLLAQHFLNEMNRRENLTKTLGADTLARLENYRWPGNVREMRNILQRAYIMADDHIDITCLPPEFGRAPTTREDPRGLHPGMSIRQAERILIFATLDHCGGNRERTADMLGISAKTLYNRLREYDEEANNASESQGSA